MYQYQVRLKAQYNHCLTVMITTCAIQLIMVHYIDTVYALKVVLLGQATATKIASSFTKLGTLALKILWGKMLLNYLAVAHYIHYH